MAINKTIGVRLAKLFNGNVYEYKTNVLRPTWLGRKKRTFFEII